MSKDATGTHTLLVTVRRPHAVRYGIEFRIDTYKVIDSPVVEDGWLCASAPSGHIHIRLSEIDAWEVRGAEAG